MFTISTVLSLLFIITGVLLIYTQRAKGLIAVGIITLAADLILCGLIRIILSQVIDTQVAATLAGFLSFTYGFLPYFLMLITLGFMFPGRWAVFWGAFLVAIISFLVILLSILPSMTGLDFAIIPSPDLSHVTTVEMGKLLVPVFSVGVLTAIVILFITRAFRVQKATEGHSSLFIVIAIVIAIGLCLVDIWRQLQVNDYTYNLFVTGYLAIGVTLLYTGRNLRSHPVSREELFDEYCDGIMVINQDNLILDINPAAEELLGIPARQAQGTPIDLILENWKNIAGSRENRDVEFRGSITLGKRRRYISVRTSRMDKRNRVIILRDITDRRDTNEARQHAREEMFNLLRSFFKSATTSQSSNDLFRDVLFQIVYTFRAESGLISLVESAEEEGKLKYTLMAKQGSFVKDSETLLNLYDALEASGWSRDHQEPLIVPDVGRSRHFSRLMPNPGNSCFGVFPLLFYEQLMGILVLTRSIESGFQNDDIVRLGVVTEELASFINSDRKRKADIALAERHRLSQDLHDSITQKLVGLLQLTEAVKLGLQSGAPVDGSRIDRISESARQALREMRLFLFELAPVNIERDGLLSILQSRLALVEGRSDIQARMLADNDIVLTTQEETEIYYIVEEALNNILKHAGAKTVSIKLQQRSDSVFLEIIDNGSGFDPDQVKEGSRGLANIRDRARRINAELSLVSSPGQGTTITLVIPK